MDVNQKALLRLIAQSQFGASDDYSFEGVDWDAVFKEATDQAVLGIVAPEVPSEFADAKWQQAQFRQTAAYIKYCHAEDELKKDLDEANIPFVVLKGNAAAIAYKDPSKRMMGDIDFIVPQGMFDKARELLLSQGYEISHESGQDTRHIALKKDETEFELHRFFSHDDYDIDDLIFSGIDHPECGVIREHEFPMLPPLANGMVLLLHMRQHLKSSLGLRQIIDWMMYVYRNLDDDFWNNEFSSVARDQGLDILAITATQMCQMYLGLSETIKWCNDADKKACVQLMDLLIASGNFGRRAGQGRLVETVTTNMKRIGPFRYLQMAGEEHWRAYHKHHWLKPFCWLYQIFRYAGQGLKTGRKGKQLKADLDRSKDRYDLLKKLGID